MLFDPIYLVCYNFAALDCIFDDNGSCLYDILKSYF